MKGSLKQIFKTELNESNKKKMETLVVFVIILIITIIAINVIWKGDEKPKENTELYGKQLASVQNENTVEAVNTENNLERNLENILSKINGVGEVKVLISYVESSEIVAMYNENTKNTSTQEEDSGGGKRSVNETDTKKDIIYKEENGEKVPITQKVISPKIEGAIIIAKGAQDATVKGNIMQAVEAVTGIATHKIQVFEMKQ